MRPDDRFCPACGHALAVAAGSSGRSPIEYERFFELAVDVFVVTGPDGRFARVNQAMARLLGVDREVILAGPWSAFVHPDDRDRSAEENAGEFAEGRRTIAFENRYVDVAGGIHWMDWNAELDPATGLVYGIARDVTTQKTALAALEEARAAADEARAAAEAANLAKSEFLSRMSHELRTPLNAVLGFGQILQMDRLDEHQVEYVDQILRGGRHLLELIDEVMDISRIEIGAVAVSVEPVQLAQTVAETLSLLGPMAAGRQVSLRSDLDAGQLAYVMADPQRLRQILVNYVSNAIKYTPPGSTATITATRLGNGWLRIAVGDDGPGIPAPLLERLFNPFERIGAEQTDVEGTGLGLVHSKALAQRMGGRVGVDSTAGAGSVFWVDLPIASPPSEATLDTAAQPPEDFADRPDTMGTVLYVEDNPSNLRLVERALALRPGIHLLSATTGWAGLDLADAHRLDLVLLDLNLPDMPGEDVLTALRADARTRDVPIVILSADATRRQVRNLLARGAADYLTKPLDLRAFLAMLDERLGAPPGPS